MKEINNTDYSRNNNSFQDNININFNFDVNVNNGINKYFECNSQISFINFEDKNFTSNIQNSQQNIMQNNNKNNNQNYE